MWGRCFILLSLVTNLPISLPRSLQELNGKANIAQNHSEHIQNREACVLPTRTGPSLHAPRGSPSH